MDEKEANTVQIPMEIEIDPIISNNNTATPVRTQEKSKLKIPTYISKKGTIEGLIQGDSDQFVQGICGFGGDCHALCVCGGRLPTLDRDIYLDRHTRQLFANYCHSSARSVSQS